MTHGAKLTNFVTRAKDIASEDERKWWETVQWFQETVNFTESAERLSFDEAGHSSCVL